MSRISVEVSHRYGELRVHEGVKFDVRPNEFVCIAGPSGCGKTTLLDILAGIQPPTSGSVRIDGEPADPKRHNISFVFQEPSTLPWLTVRDNVAFGLRVKNRPDAEIAQAVDEILGVVSLRGYEDYYPHQISGGMKQRVAIARAFATRADLVLMDEPFVSLDQPTRERMQREVLDIWQHHRRTIIFVTHNLEEAVFLGDRVLILSSKPATIVADIAVDLPRPRDILSADFTELRRRCVTLLHEEHARAAGPSTNP